MSNRDINMPASQTLQSLVSTMNQWVGAFTNKWLVYSLLLSSTLFAVTLFAVFTGTAMVLVPSAFVLITLGVANHLRLSSLNDIVQSDLTKAEKKLANEASASRILSGVRTLRSNSSLSADARLASAARMATEYPAAVVFNLRDSLGVLAPSNWSYDGQLSHIRDEFEPIDSNHPGAVAARQGSAIVVSMSADSEQSLPEWAKQSGFTQGIVSPITRGLDTVGVVYVLNKSSVLPTLPEIEQLELIVSFSSFDTSALRPNAVTSQNQPFRVIEKSTSTSAPLPITVPIRFAGFALNPESERMEMDGVRISLSPTEFLLMHTLASSPEKPVSAVELMDRCWSQDSRPAHNAIDVTIFRLRKKLNKTSAGKGIIKTVRGSGYMFIPPETNATPQIVAD
ncbi:MAG: response regulator transcription factor [Dehalococcoidia bacterium]|nr:response regulator transcription factor [Dehalococcoidia bacterium]